MQKHTLFVSLQLLFVVCDATEKLSNIDYIGLGYDIIMGNPHNDMYDPGFRAAVFDFNYTQQTQSLDGRWLIPDHVQALQNVACGYETESVEVHDMSSYHKSLTIEASVHAGGPGFEFSGSVGFKDVQKGISNYQNVYVESVAMCIQYKVAIRGFTPPSVSGDFAKAVEALPLKQGTEYLQFLLAFGTHYLDTTTMGAKAITRSEFNSTSWASLKQNNFDIKVAASASFMSFSAGAKFVFEEQSTMKNSYDSKRRGHKASYLGSHPPSDGNWETWAYSTGRSPYPIQYTLQPLTRLFTTAYIKNNSQSSLDVKRQLMETYVQYCGAIQGCDLRDPIPGKCGSSSFVMQMSRTQGLSSRCPEIGCANSTVTTLSNCKEFAAQIGGNAFNFLEGAGNCCVKQCARLLIGKTVSAAPVTSSYGSWDVYVCNA